MIRCILVCLMIAILLIVASCGTIRKAFSSGGGDAVTTKAEEVKQELVTDQEEVELLDRVLSTPILILYAVATLGFIAGGVVCIYRAKLILAGACGCGALLTGVLPVIIAVFFKALIILLYVFIGFLIIILGLVAWFIFRKVDNHLDREELEELKN